MPPKLPTVKSLGLIGLGAVMAAGLLLSAGATRDDDLQPVVVTNFPETQRVNGSVSLEGTIHQAALISISDIEVRPLLKPTDSRRLVLAGTLTTDGFGAIVLSLLGQTKGFVMNGGEVGAILVPDEEPVIQALEERGLMQFPLEVKAAPAFENLYFSSAQPRYILGFPRYRVYLYNTTNAPVSVDLYAYLTN